MGCLVVLVLAVLVLGAGMWVTVGLFALLMTLLIAGLVGWAADAVVPGKLPGGWFGAVLAGMIGGRLGHLVVALPHPPSLGAVIGRVHPISPVLGAAGVA